MSYDQDLHAGRGVGQYMGLEQREVGNWEAGDVRVVARGELGEHLFGPGGGVRTGVLLTMCDNAAGFTGGLAALPDGWVVSTNMHLRRFATAITGPIRIETAVLRRGRRAVVTNAEVFDESSDAALVADCVLTCAVLVPQDGPPHWDRPAYLAAVPARGAPPILEAFGITPDSGRDDDAVVLEVAEELRNPWGIVHGGVTATLVDVAAERAVMRSTDATRALTTDVTLRYLAPGREGPLVATPTVLGNRSDGCVVRVNVTDQGHHSRTIVAATATARPLR